MSTLTQIFFVCTILYKGSNSLFTFCHDVTVPKPTSFRSHAYGDLSELVEPGRGRS